MKIQAEQDGIRVLGAVLTFRCGMSWTTGSLRDLTKLSDRRAIRAVANLNRLGYLVTYKGEWSVTTEGEAYYGAAKSKPHVGGSVHAWKDEVLTGMTPAGKQTQIDPAALPGPPIRDAPPGPEEMIGRSQEQDRAMRRAAKKLGLSPEKFKKFFDEDRIKECCVGEEGQHTGIFDKNGKGFRPRCRACEKKRLNGKANNER